MTDPVVDPNEKALVDFYKVVDPTKASVQLVRNTLEKYKGRLAEVFLTWLSEWLNCYVWGLDIEL